VFFIGERTGILDPRRRAVSGPARPAADFVVFFHFDGAGTGREKYYLVLRLLLFLVFPKALKL